VKTFARHIFKLAKMPLKKSPVCISHAKQMKYYWGFFLKQNNCKSLEEMRNSSQAPLNHLDLNNNVDRQVYDDILHIVKQFSTDKMLIETMHLGHAPAKASLNNRLSYFAPKNINYARSSSFLYRVSIKVGIQRVG